MNKNIKKNTMYNIFKMISSLIIPMIVFSYASRVLGPENVGKINFGYSIIGYISLLASMGISTYATRECAKYRDDKIQLGKVSSQIFSINVWTTIVAYVFLIILLLSLEKLHGYCEIIIIQSISVIFTTLGAEWLNMAMEDFKYITIRTLVCQFLGAVLVFVFVKNREDFIKYALISLLSSAGASICNIFYRQKYCSLKIVANLNLRNHLKPIVMLFVLLLAQTVFVNIDITMIGWFFDDYEVGVYSAAVKLYMVVSNLSTMIYVVVLPQISRSYQNNEKDNIKRLQEYAIGYILSVGVPMFVGGELLAKEIICLAVGNQYLEAVYEMRILFCALPLVFVGGGFIGNVICIGTGRERIFNQAYIIGVFANVILNAFLIPIAGPFMAAWTTVFSEAIILFCLFVNTKKEIDVKNIIVLMIKTVLGSAFFVPIVWGAEYLIENAAVRLLICIFLCAVCYSVNQVLLKNSFILEALRVIKRK